MSSHLSHDEFFTSLTSLLSQTSQKARGSIYLTQKPLLHPQPAPTQTTQTTQSQENNTNNENVENNNETSQQLQRPSILIRATDGNTNAPHPKSNSNSNSNNANNSDSKDKSSKFKVSTVVSPEDLEAFYVRYADVCKAGMSGLKKKQRKRKGKGKGGGGGGAGKVSKG